MLVKALTVLLAMLLVATVSCDRVRPLPKRAECERKAGHTLEALELVEEHLLKKPRDKKALKLRDALRAELVHAELYSEPEGALVSVDGADPAGSTPLTVPLDAGRHTFRFTLEGHQPLERTQDCVAGTRPNVTAVLEPLPRPQEPAPAVAEAGPAPAAPAEAIAVQPAAEQKPVPARERQFSNVPLVIGAAGLFVAIGGGVLILTSALSPVTDTSAAYRQYAGYALAGVGVAAGIAAIVWLLFERRPGAPLSNSGG